MKIRICLLYLLAVAATGLQAQNRMNVHLKSGETVSFSILDVSSVDWGEAPESMEPEYEDIVIEGNTYHLGLSGAIDLALEVKWAAYNVGAASPSEFGKYYSWGETETKDAVSWTTYFDSVDGSSSNFKKYAVDKEKQLAPVDDVAHVKWKGDWRMPTKAEQDNLRSKCTFVWMQYGNHNGCLVIGNNGNAIFFPAAGGRSPVSPYDADSNCHYWSSSLSKNSSISAFALDISDGIKYYNNTSRHYALSVRPVCP